MKSATELVSNCMKSIPTVLCVILVLVLITGPGLVVRASVDQDYVALLNSVIAERMLGTIANLTGDGFGGRQSGTEGATLASEYLSNYFENLGLKPAGADGTYRTQFTVPLWQLTQLPQLKLIGSPVRDFVYRKDFSVQPGRARCECSNEARLVPA